MPLLHSQIIQKSKSKSKKGHRRLSLGVLVLEGGINVWVESGQEYRELMDVYEAGKWQIARV